MFAQYVLKAPVSGCSGSPNFWIGLQIHLRVELSAVSGIPELERQSWRKCQHLIVSNQANLKEYRSLVIDELSEQLNQPSDIKIGLAYVYCDYRDQQEQTTMNLVGAMLKQLLATLSAIPQETTTMYEQKYRQGRQSLEGSDAIALFHSTCGAFDRTYICFDALDECKDMEPLLNTLQEMPSSVRIFTTSRKHIQKVVQRHFQQALSISVEANESDVRAFVKSRIDENRIKFADIMDERLEKEILEKIIGSSKGMLVAL